jgi:hypothetical protein
MSTTSTEYEYFVAKLIKGIQDSNRKITDLGKGQTNKIEGISGVKHQIDVSFLDHSFTSPTLVLIECKRFQDDSVALEHIKVLQATRDDIIQSQKSKSASSVKAIIITTVGVQSGAQRYADFYGIDIEKLPHDEKNFTFQYENIISVGKVISLGKMPITATATLVKRCEKCDFSFVTYEGKKQICPNCSWVQENRA